jgi:hypothetical protein
MEENKNLEAIENFDVMKWLRGVRDANYERLGHLPTAEYIHQLSEEGRQAALWKKMDDKSAQKHTAK